MKRFLLSFALLITGLAATAQSAIKFGYLNADSLLRTLPAYAQVEEQMHTLMQKYQAETDYNEQNFRRQYAEFLQGQKQFTQNILTKRQVDLQRTLERSLTFRRQADSLIVATRQELLVPVRAQLQQAINAVGMERGYEYVLDTSKGVYPFIHPQVGEDATPWVKQKLADMAK